MKIQVIEIKNPLPNPLNITLTNRFFEALEAEEIEV